MRIIIVGAGEVGVHLSKLLAKEHIDITLMDADPSKLAGLEDNYDMLTQEGNPTSIQDLEDLNVKDADLFIAVTTNESVNITACMLASHLGSDKTLARIENPEYIQPKNRELFQKLGVDHLIYPENLAANEIISALETNWLRQKLSFCDGELVLMGIKIRKNAPIINKKLNSGYFDHRKYGIVAIKRKHDTIIPTGVDEILSNDTVYFITKAEDVKFVKEQAGKSDYKIHSVMFMGGGHITQRAVHNMPSHISMKILEKDRAQSYLLAETCKNTLIINADARDMDILKDEGIEHIDAFVAATSNSEENILACLAAKNLGVKKTVAEVENIDYIALAENMDIGTVINKKMIAASYIYQLTLDADVLDVRALTYADAEVVEFVAKKGSKITKAKIKNLRLPEKVNIGAYVRDGKGYIISGDTVLQADDQVICFCVSSAIRKIESFFN